MKKNNYEDYMTQNHINVLEISELITEKAEVTKFFGYEVLGCIDEVSQKFKIVYVRFDKSAKLLLNCHARNEYEEAALHDLRHAMETLFYKIKEDFPGNDFMQYGALCDGAKYLVSIFIRLPNIMHDREKKEIFNYVVKNNLLH